MLVGWWAVLLVGWMVGWLADWWLVGSAVGWLFGWLVGQSIFPKVTLPSDYTYT